MFHDITNIECIISDIAIPGKNFKTKTGPTTIAIEKIT